MAYETFIELFGADDLSAVPIHYFADFRKFCALQEKESYDFLERVDQAALQRFSIGLVETVLKQFDDPEELTASNVRNAHQLLTCFVNISARSQRFRKTVEKHMILHWLTLLRFEHIRGEVLASLTTVSRELHKGFLLEDMYYQLLSDLVALWNMSSIPADHRSWISAFFAALLEDDYAFLSECFTMLEREMFSELLVIVETLLDKTSTGKQVQVNILDWKYTLPKIHPNNIRFCVDLFERVDYELANSLLPLAVNDTGSRFSLLTDIFACAALQRPLYDESLHKEQRAMRLVCGMLKAILEAEATIFAAQNYAPAVASPSRKRTFVDSDEDLFFDKEEDKKDESNENSETPLQENNSPSSASTTLPELADEQPHPATPERHEDKPPDPKCPRRVPEIFFKSGEKLIKLIRNKRIAVNIVANMKQSAVRCIGNLCMDNPANCTAAASCDAVYLLIQCGRRTEYDRAYLAQWMISSLKQLCINSPENQEKLLNVEATRPNLMVNRERLLQSLGLKAVLDEVTGKLKLEKIEDEA